MNEKIFIETGRGTVTVAVAGINRGQVKLAINAPLDMRIDREEVAQKRREEKQP